MVGPPVRGGTGLLVAGRAWDGHGKSTRDTPGTRVSPRLPPIARGWRHDGGLDEAPDVRPQVSMRQRRVSDSVDWQPERTKPRQTGHERSAGSVWERSPVSLGRNHPRGGSSRRDWMLILVKRHGAGSGGNTGLDRDVEQEHRTRKATK